MQIRRATAADAALLADLAARTFVEKWSAHNTAEDLAAYCAENFSPDLQLAELLDPATTYMLAEIDGTAVGYTRLRRGKAPDCVPHPTALEMVRLYALAAYHGRRVGATLMEAALTEARALGAPAMWLGVWPDNHQALKFYRAWGFAEVGRKIFKLGDDISEDLIMVRAV